MTVVDVERLREIAEVEFAEGLRQFLEFVRTKL